MSNLLIELKGNNFINKTIFPHRLYFYDDILLYKKKHFLRSKEVTIAYSHIVQVDLDKGIFFSTLKIINTGVETIVLMGLNKKKAAMAKKLIDQKIYMEHAKHSPDHGNIDNDLLKYEKGINRLKELWIRGKITEKEYNSKKSTLLKDMK